MTSFGKIPRQMPSRTEKSWRDFLTVLNTEAHENAHENGSEW